MNEYAKLVIAVDSTQARNANKDLGALERGASTLTAGLGRMIGPLVSVATAMAALNKASDIQRQFDVLNAGLITATGSTEKAAAAFKALQSFAQKTPYDLNQAVDGFTKLVNLGLTPSERALASYGNTASAMGKDLNQMIEAVADATTGEFERLKEFGIKSRVAGDSIAFTFQGVTKSVGNNAAEIEKYLADLGENQFAGAMKLRMDTLDGAIANLGDTWDTTFRLINESGLGEVMRDSVNEAITALDELNAQLASGELEATLSAIAGKFDGFGKDIGLAFDEISKLFESDSGYWSSLLEHNVANMTATFRDLPENVRAFMKLMTVEVLSGFDTVKAYARAFNDGINAIFSNDTFEGVGVRLDAELSAVSKTRQDGIQYILNEREASLASFDAQIKGATERRRAFDEAAAADAADTTDRLAQFKAITDGSKAQSDEDKKAAKAAETLVNQRKKALDSLILQSAISTKSSNDMADAYLAGADSVRELAIQQKIEEELLKTGAGARDAVTAAVNREADAKDRLDITQSIASMRTETTQTLAQATATLQGKDALEAFNIQKSMTVA
ncbi:tape measure protein, partial [Pseudomonas lundensis]|uniref:tape measure protein n=1 Tax=Pseudomonas lundensis TaxID=86185 RepID=UPI0020C75258